MSTATKRPVAALAVVAGLLIPATPASGGTAVGNPGDPDTRTSNVTCPFPDVCKTSIVYNGHAGLGLNGPTWP